MIKFFEKPSKWILGCDPGPEHSAFALLRCDEMTGKPELIVASYIPNREINCATAANLWTLMGERGSGLVPAMYGRLTYAFEKCAVQAGGANAMVFETCMMAGELRYLFSHDHLVRQCAFSPSDWRYILTGKGCANDANVRAILLTLVPDCDTILRSYSKKAKKMYELKKPITSHLRDAVGVALATGFVNYRRGLTLDQFPARLEVHCG